jgi:regulator of nonsense transcripts 2
LTLEKYLSELVLALAETKLKSTADALAAAELCTDLHLRFGPAFTEPLMEELFKLIEPPPVPAASSDLSIAAPGGDQKDKEEAARLSKMKSALRQILELFLVGIVHAKYKDSTIKELLKRLVCPTLSKRNLSNAPGNSYKRTRNF